MVKEVDCVRCGDHPQMACHSWGVGRLVAQLSVRRRWKEWGCAALSTAGRGDSGRGSSGGGSSDYHPYHC